MDTTTPTLLDAYNAAQRARAAASDTVRRAELALSHAQAALTMADETADALAKLCRAEVAS